jgi:alpha-methylacyl-CoA racemase
MSDASRKGPLAKLKIVEFAGIGPTPFCGMLLSDLGADVVRIDRPGRAVEDPTDVTARGRRSVALDLKRPESIATCLKLLDSADALIEGYRPGVMERLGLGPEVIARRNRRLVYGRMTGWGQDGPWALAAGHDLNYIALTGALSAIGVPERPVPPLNLVGDYGGGSLYLAFGLLAAILHARETGDGQVVDCAMADGSASLMSLFYGLKAGGRWNLGRGTNFLDGAAHYYQTYECADGKWISLAAIEPQFYAEFLRRAGIEDEELLQQGGLPHWPSLRAKLSQVFRRKQRAEWCELLGGTDACFAPVLDLEEAPSHPQNVARNAFVEIEGVLQPAPAPRFSGTPGAVQRPPPATGAHNDEVLLESGLSRAEVDQLRATGCFGVSPL